MIKLLLLLILFVFQCANLLAGSFRHLNVKEGLSSRQVFQISKDSTGFIWAYTHMGVDRYDGNEIKHYNLDETIESKDHILSSTIMICNNLGNIWIGLKNGRIYAYDKLTDSFLLKVDLSHFLSSPILNNMLFDDEDRLWLCMSTGLYHWNFEKNDLSLAGLKSKCVNCIIQTGRDTFFAGTNSHVYTLKKNERNISSESEIKFPIEAHIESIYTLGQKLYVGTFSDGVYVVDLSTKQVKSLNDFIPNVPIRTFVPTRDNTILIGTDGAGMFQIDTVNEKLINRYVTNEDDDRSLNGNTISDICVDEYNGIWVSTCTNGISYLDPNQPDVQWVKHEQNNSNSLISDHINVMLQDSEGDCWYGTNNGISLYQSKFHKWTHFLDEKGHSTGYSSVVLALCEDDNGDVWAGGYGIGIYCINKHSGSVQKMKRRSKNSSEGISTDYIYSIYAEGDHIWFGGIEGEFTRYNKRTDIYTYYPIDCIGDIEQGKDGSLLIAGCEGLAFFDKVTGEIKWHRKFGETTLSYPIRCLTEASNGDIWLATDGEGLVRFNPTNNQSRIYTTNDGLLSNSVNSVVEDASGRIWFNTEKELYCLDLSKGIILNMNDFLDINWGYYNSNAAIREKNGRLSFGTAEGAISFSPSHHFGHEVSARLIFTDFKLLYQSIKAGAEGSLLKRSINDTESIRLKYAQNSFTVSFSAINFVASHRVRYEYKLENFEEEWQRSNTIKSVNYMNLAPGKYTFRLRAFDKYTQREIGERSFDIRISQPLWLSWWAIILYILVIAAFTYLIVQYRRHQASENKANEKIQSFISFAHDIRTPVTLIKTPLTELERQEGLPEESKKVVAVAVKNVEKLFEMVTQLLNLQKEDLYSETLRVAWHDVSAYMEEKVSDFRMAATQKGVDLHLGVETDIPNLCFDKEKMNRILDNLLSNALKYTEDGSISVFVRKTRRKWIIEIKDTGVGIPQAEQTHIFREYYRAENVVNSEETGLGIGLMITRRMIKQHQGTILFRSVENGGTTFTVTFPLKLKSCVFADKEEISEDLPVNYTQEDASVHKNVLLLAEDDKDMREYLIDSLSSEYKVVSVPDGGKALELAKEINPDLIISDVIMPVLQGYELCRILKSSVEVIFLSFY